MILDLVVLKEIGRSKRMACVHPRPDYIDRCYNCRNDSQNPCAIQEIVAKAMLGDAPARRRTILTHESRGICDYDRRSSNDENAKDRIQSGS